MPRQRILQIWVKTVLLFISRKKEAPSHPNMINAAYYKLNEVFFHMFFRSKAINSAEDLPYEPEYDDGLVRKRYSYFYLRIPKRLGKFNGPSKKQNYYF